MKIFVSTFSEGQKIFCLVVKNLPTLRVKRWCPELKDVPAKHIHDWEHHYHEYPNVDYPAPIVFFDERKKEVLEWYKNYVQIGGAKPHGIDINEAEIYEGMFDDEEEEMEERDLEDI